MTLFNLHMRLSPSQNIRTLAGRIRVPAAALAAAALLGLTLLAPRAQAESSGLDSTPPLTISFQYEIDFGHGVDVEIVTELAAPLAEVKAIYSAVGPRQVSSYAYPALTRSETLTANFTIETGPPAYYPPGTEFEAFLELTAPDGTVTTTERKRFLYLDPAKNWQTLSLPDIPLDFHYYGFSVDTANGLAERVSSSWTGIAVALGVDPATVERRRAIIYPSVRDASASFPPTSAAASDGTYFGGFALDRYNLFVIGGPWPDTAVHELTHLLVGQVVNSPLSPGVPSWLNEGLAQYFEAGSASYYSRQLGAAARSGDLLTLRTRKAVPSKADEISLFYVEAGSFVGELIELEGPERMAETLRLINDGSTAAEAMETVYGRPLWQIENEWRERLGASALPAPVDTSATPPAQANATAKPQATATSTAIGDSGVALEPDAPGDRGGGFDMTGPLIGAIAAAVVFSVWSFFVNRRRFRRRR